jgi:hypothetical protein
MLKNYGAQQSFSACIGGHLTLPYLQNTKQSPGSRHIHRPTRRSTVSAICLITVFPFRPTRAVDGEQETT